MNMIGRQTFYRSKLDFGPETLTELYQALYKSSFFFKSFFKYFFSLPMNADRKKDLIVQFEILPTISSSLLLLLFIEMAICWMDSRLLRCKQQVEVVDVCRFKGSSWNYLYELEINHQMMLYCLLMWFVPSDNFICNSWQQSSRSVNRLWKIPRLMWRTVLKR